jgi:hypothetical protein
MGVSTLQAQSANIIALSRTKNSKIEYLNQAARDQHPERWSGPTRNWTPITVVSLNPERDLEHTPLDQAV